MDSKPVVRVKRKKPTKSKKSKKSKTIKSKVGQVININIGTTNKRRARNYMTPSKTQQHNLIPATLIGQRSEPYDLQLLNKLQQRVIRLDNLAAGLYDRDYAMEEQQTEQQNQTDQAIAETLSREKEKEKEIQPPPQAESRPTKGRPRKNITKAEPTDPIVSGLFASSTPAYAEALSAPDLNESQTGELIGQKPKPKKLTKKQKEEQELALSAIGTRSMFDFVKRKE